jgi:hypothetical protein
LTCFASGSIKSVSLTQTVEDVGHVFCIVTNEKNNGDNFRRAP